MAIEIVDFPIKNGDFPWQNVSSPEVYTAALQMLMLNVHPWQILPTPNVSGKLGAWLMRTGRTAYGHPSKDKETTNSIDWRWKVVFYLFVMRPYLNDDDPGKYSFYICFFYQQIMDPIWMMNMMNMMKYDEHSDLNEMVTF